jgi:hypothetical protein
MATKKSFRVGVVLISTLCAPGAFVAACSSDNSNPIPPVYTLDSGTAVDTGTPSSQADSSTGADSSPSNGDGSPSADANADTTPIATQPDGAPIQPEDAATCETDAGCWSCTPTSPPEFLNQCTSSQCSPFDNASRLPDYDGGLPPLP